MFSNILNNSRVSSIKNLLILKLKRRAEIDKLQIQSDNKEKAEIYKWTTIESGQIYIESAVDTSKRLSDY
jgi:hypothetical protein